MSRVVVAMSGGVDSSVAAALMVEAGHEVVGVTLQLYDDGRARASGRSCCAGQDIRDAAEVARRLGVAHYVLDYESRFSDEVMRAFADAYARGETPVPCVTCNRTVKFRDLLATARDLGAERLVTGHYVRRVEGPDGPELHRGRETARDQSYFLHATTRTQLSYLAFPIGDMTKPEVRAIAAIHDLPVADKPDSQDICFVPDGRYVDVVRRLRPDTDRPGAIVDIDGREVGRHQGVIGFTIGQRRGLGIAGGEPLYVVAIDAARGLVQVGPRAALGQRRIPLAELNWLGSGAGPAPGQAVAAKLRSMRPPAPGRLLIDEDGPSLMLDSPEEGVAAGQSAVFYDGTRVLGGGTIRAMPRATIPAVTRATASAA
jgi:tRNA-specific 2-thiouridylase